MGRGLLEAEPAFAAQVDKLGDPFTEHTGRSLRALLRSAGPFSLPETQLAIFGTQVALAARWEALGVRPAAVLGHSLGSAAAAVVSGVLSADEAVHLVATRARLLGTVRPGGAMAAVELTPEELLAYPDVELAVDSAPRQVTVAAAAEVLDRLVAELEAAGRTARRLPVEVAGHSAEVEPVLGPLRDALAEFGGRRPLVPWYDTVLTDPRELPDFDARYWAAHLRRPVRFRQAVTAAGRGRAPGVRRGVAAPDPAGFGGPDTLGGGLGGCRGDRDVAPWPGRGPRVRRGGGHAVLRGCLVESCRSGFRGAAG